MTSSEALVAHLAVTLCSSVGELGLGAAEQHRQPLGAAADTLARRLTRVRALDDADARMIGAARIPSEPLDVNDLDPGEQELRLAVGFTTEERRLLTVAVQRLRGLIALGEFDLGLPVDVVAAQLQTLAEALAGR